MRSLRPASPRLRSVTLVATWGVLLALLPLSAVAQSNYPGPAAHPSPGAPRGLAAGDLNGDGLLDVAATAHSISRILIHPGLGDGSLTVPRSIFVGGAPVAVAVTDFDRDGLDDVVYVDDLGGEVGVLLQRSTFPVSYEVQTVRGADEPQSLLIGDFNGDTWLDVAVAQSGADQISICDNLQGVLAPPRPYSVGDSPIRLAALDHLGSSHLFVLNDGYLSQDLMNLDLSNSGLAARLDLNGPTDMLALDHDGDGEQELVVLDGGAGQVMVYGTGDGVSFSVQDSWAVQPGSRVLRVLDGAPGLPRYLVGDSARASYSVYESVAGSFTKRRSWLGGQDLRDLLLADLDGDGALEVIVSLTDQDALQISAPLGAGFTAYETVFTGSAPSRVRARPTGRPSYSILCPGSNEVLTYDVVNHGLVLVDAVGVDEDAIRHGWVDFDRDGLEDLVTLVARRGIQVHRNEGTGFGAPTTYPLDGELRDLLVFDSVGDSLPDLVVANSTLSALVMLEGDGSTGFAAADTMVFAQRPARIRACDLDVDGRDDLVVLGLESQVAITFRRSDGMSNQTVWGVGNESRDAAFGDFNGDAYPDIVIANAGGSSFSILNSVVQGIYSATTTDQETPSGAENVLVTDIDLSGQDDIIFSSPSSQYATYHLNTGTPSSPTGRFTIPQRVRVGILPLGMHVADLDGDAVEDFMVVDAASNTIVLVRSNPLVLTPLAEAQLSASLDGEQVSLVVSGTAVTSAEFQLRRQSDEQRLTPKAVALGQWTATDRIAADASETYLLYDRAGHQLDKVRVVGPVADEGSRTAWSILTPRVSDGVTEIRFRSPSDAPPRVDIVDLRGRRVARLVAEPEGVRWYRVRWEGLDDGGARVSRGRYWARLVVGSEARSVSVRAPRN